MYIFVFDTNILFAFIIFMSICKINFVCYKILKRRIAMQDEFEANRIDFKYCCAAKQYYSSDVCLSGNSLKISPRVIIFKKCFKIHNCYESTLNVLNNGLYKRYLDVTTDNSDTTVRIYPKESKNNFLPPSQSFQIHVRIEPTTKLEINRCRHVFIISQHPSITFAVPIIILAKSDDADNISAPLYIKLPPTTVEHFSYYRMIVYNKSDKKLKFSIKCPFSNLTVQAKSLNIRKKDYADILVKLYCKDLEIIENSLRLKLNNGDKYDITFKHEPLRRFLFVDTLNINFECLRFKCKKMQELLICNESNKDIVFNINFISQEETVNGGFEEKLSVQQNSENASNENTDCIQNQYIDKFSYKHFTFEPNCGTIHANSSYAVKISFCPVMHEDFLPKENQFSPFSITAGVLISAKNELNTSMREIILKGEIMGPKIEILPAVLNLCNIYFGEEQFVEFAVQNKDDLSDAVVNLWGLSNLKNARAIATPKHGLFLKPNQRDVFRLQFYVTKIGGFLFNIELKVKNGARYSIILKGNSKPVRVKTFPENLNLGVIPIAIPQKRFIFLMNPLTVPITVQCNVNEDGYDIPLLLNVHDTEEHLPITVKDPSIYLQQYYECNEKSYHDMLQFEEEFELICDNEGEQEYEHELLSMRSLSGGNTSCSTEFAISTLDYIPDMSRQLVSYLKTINILNQPEVEKKVIEEALNVLLKTPYFSEMDKYKNYTQMDWNSLATHPQEIYYNTEIIYLKPKTGKAVAIVVVPNVLGYHVKHLELRVCPFIQSTDATERRQIMNIDFSQIVETDILSSKFRIEYNCCVPEIIWDNLIVLKDQVYAGEFYDFHMEFRNNNQFGGFFYYDVIPQTSLGTMSFSNKTWKYFIEPGSKISVPCQVKFSKPGPANLFGTIKLVGIYASYPFQIQAQVLSPRVNIFPRKICKVLAVLEILNLYIFIENATPTGTWFQFKLKDDSRMSFEPHGGQLAPNSQATYVTLNAKFQDPGIYKNILYVILEFEIVEKIPITINVRGMPIFFEPEIRGKDLNFGYLLCASEEINCDIEQHFSKVIKVINKGLRAYRLSITRTRNSSKYSCAVNSTKTKITIQPNNLIIPALTKTSFNIVLNSTEVISLFNEFRLQLTEENNIKHMESSRFTLSAEFILPELSWNKREVTMKYQPICHYKESEQWEIVKLKNNMESCVENVKLKISGPFKIKELFEQKFEKEMNFSMKSFETKEFFIVLDKEMLISRSNKIYDGIIWCSVNLRVQKSVRLRVFVYIPEITLKKKQIMLFSDNDEGRIYIELTNSGQIPATYKWKKLKEELRYISQEDNVWQVATMVLSDLLDIVELGVNDPEINLTLRNRKCKCFLEELKDPINVKEILYEIIQNLNMNVKPNKMTCQVPVKTTDHFEEEKIRYETNNLSQIENAQENKSEINIKSRNNFEESKTLFLDCHVRSNTFNSTVATAKGSNTKDCVYYALDGVLNHLKLEDSCDICSVSSSETCEVKNTVYFLEKRGLLLEAQETMCALHIPPIKKGFEVRAEFQLKVAGGETQQLEIVLVNLDKPINISKQNIYLGLKPWYEQYRTVFCIGNATNYQLSLKLQTIPLVFKQKLPKIALGFCNIVGNKTLQLSPLQNTIIGIEGIMGFAEDFKRRITVIANESREKYLELDGHGAMPMLAMLKSSLPILDEKPDGIEEEYHLLQKIYYFEIFKTFRDQEEDFFCAMPEEENDLQEVQMSTMSANTTADGTETRKSFWETQRDQNFLQLMGTYVFISQNEDLPNYKVLHQLLETEKFLNRLRLNPETSALLNSLYHNYLLKSKSHEEQTLTSISLKYFNIQSLPFHLKAHILDMGKVYLNQFCKFTLTLDFYGPGKLIAAATTAVKISGLMIDFQVFETFEKEKFTYYRTEDITNSCDTPYRNINERVLDKKMSSKVRHAHSYDFNTQQQHQRIIKPENIKCLKKNYDSLNKSVYLERKQSFTYCKITGNKTYNNAGNINLILLFRPQKAHFEHNQNLEDYLFIDLHLGATLPILLRALIIDPKRKNKS